MVSRGARSIIGLGRLFRKYDLNGDRKLQDEEFSNILTDLRLGFDAAQITSLFRLFDAQGNGCINYEEFLRGIRGVMNPFRQELAFRAF